MARTRRRRRATEVDVSELAPARKILRGAARPPTVDPAFTLVDPNAEITREHERQIAAIWTAYPTPKPKIIVDTTVSKVQIDNAVVLAAYNPLMDLVRVPRKLRNAEEAKYLFHEIVHSTGHPKRLNRPVYKLEFFTDTPVRGLAGERSFASGKEEVTAEMGAEMICLAIGLDVNRAATRRYVAHYLRWMVVHSDLYTGKIGMNLAVGDAARAVEYITGNMPRKNPPAVFTDAVDEITAIATAVIEEGV